MLPYFLLGALSLATAHAARAPEDATAARRDAPWVVSVLGTIGALSAVMALFMLLALFEAQRALEPIGAGLMELIRNSLLLAGIDALWQQFFVGLFLILAVLLEQIRNRRRN